MNPKDFIEQAKDYADGIKLGYEIQDKHLKDERIKNFIEKNKRELRQPTAYALAIEARFSKNMTINMPKYDNPSKLELKLINNTIQNLIYRNKKETKTKKVTL